MKNQDDIQDKINIDESPKTEAGLTQNPNLRHPERSEGSPELSTEPCYREIFHCVQDDSRRVLRKSYKKKIWIAPNLRVLLDAQHIQGGNSGDAETNGGLWQS